MAPGSLAGRTWVNFLASQTPADPPFVGTLIDGGICEYRVDDTRTIRGRSLNVARGWQITRVQSLARIPAFPCELCLSAVTQHSMYTGAADRQRLAKVSTEEGGRIAVLIPIAKSEEWWAMAQDERDAFFQCAKVHAGHIRIGEEYAPVILRRLYHARYLPGSEWDFLTYFEFTEKRAPQFRELLATLRDVKKNPEWKFVNREVEIWMKKIG